MKRFIGILAVTIILPGCLNLFDPGEKLSFESPEWAMVEDTMDEWRKRDLPNIDTVECWEDVTTARWQIVPADVLAHCSDVAIACTIETHGQPFLILVSEDLVGTSEYWRAIAHETLHVLSLCSGLQSRYSEGHPEELFGLDNGSIEGTLIYE